MHVRANDSGWVVKLVVKAVGEENCSSPEEHLPVAGAQNQQAAPGRSRTARRAPSLPAAQQTTQAKDLAAEGRYILSYQE